MPEASAGRMGLSRRGAENSLDGGHFDGRCVWLVARPAAQIAGRSAGQIHDRDPKTAIQLLHLGLQTREPIFGAYFTFRGWFPSPWTVQSCNGIIVAKGPVAPLPRHSGTLGRALLVAAGNHRPRAVMAEKCG